MQGHPLKIVSSYTVTVGSPAMDQVLREIGHAVLDAAKAQIRARAPELRVESELLYGSPVPLLLEQSQEASVIVVGSRGAGSFEALLLGSVAVGVTAHAHCPVVVVRGADGAAGHGAGSRVVVGVDGSDPAAAAMEFAIAEASRRRLPLHALWAWQLPPIYGPTMYPALVDRESCERETQTELSEELAGWREKYPDMSITESVEQSHRLRRWSGHRRPPTLSSWVAADAVGSGGCCSARSVKASSGTPTAPQRSSTDPTPTTTRTSSDDGAHVSRVRPPLLGRRCPWKGRCALSAARGWPDTAVMGTESDTGVTVLATHAGWTLLPSAGVGRLGVSVAGEPDIFRVNFAVDQETVVFRTAPGAKLANVAIGQVVAFEVDGYDAEAGEAWSVVVKGRGRQGRSTASYGLCPRTSAAAASMPSTARRGTARSPTPGVRARTDRP
jgi:nucleotide-binding universal stress UspA family protein